MQTEIIKLFIPVEVGFLRSNFKEWSRLVYRQDTQETLVYIRNLDLTIEDAQPWAYGGLTTRFLIQTNASAPNLYGKIPSDEIYRKAQKEYEKHKKIEGYEVYCVSKNEKVWISKIVWESLEISQETQ